MILTTNDLNFQISIRVTLKISFRDLFKRITKGFTDGRPSLNGLRKRFRIDCYKLNWVFFYSKNNRNC